MPLAYPKTDHLALPDHGLNILLFAMSYTTSTIEFDHTNLHRLYLFNAAAFYLCSFANNSVYSPE